MTDHPQRDPWADLTEAEVRRIFALDRAISADLGRVGDKNAALTARFDRTVEQLTADAQAIHDWLFPEEETP